MGKKILNEARSGPFSLEELSARRRAFALSKRSGVNGYDYLDPDFETHPPPRGRDGLFKPQREWKADEGFPDNPGDGAVVIHPLTKHQYKFDAEIDRWIKGDFLPSAQQRRRP